MSKIIISALFATLLMLAAACGVQGVLTSEGNVRNTSGVTGASKVAAAGNVIDRCGVGGGKCHNQESK